MLKWSHNSQIPFIEDPARKLPRIYQNKACFRCSVLCRKDHKLMRRLSKKARGLKIYHERKIITANRIDAITKSNVFHFGKTK